MPEGFSAEQKQTQRSSSIELLRILSMIMIVACHFATHGGFTFDAQNLSLPRFWWHVLEMGGNFGVDVFVLISGYFLIGSQNGLFPFKRILKFWGQVVFYSVLIYLIFGFAGIGELGISSFVKSFFPITFKSWWFASTYFVLYLLHPFINMLLQKLDKAMYQKLLVMLVILWSVIPTLTTTSYQGSQLTWFVTLYCIAGYVRRYGLNPKFTVKHYLGFWALFSILRYLSSVVMIFLGRRIPFAYKNTILFFEQDSILTLLSALAFFMVFEKMDMGYHRWINIIASATFGVYLIHDSDFIRNFLWLTVFKSTRFQDSAFLIPYSVFAVAAVYAVCTVIDLLRKAVFEKPYMRIVDRYSDSWLKPFEAICDLLKKAVFGK